MGQVEGIYLASQSEAPCEPVERARFVAGRDITLIEAEAIEALAAETGIELGPGEPRRNVVTRGIDLDDLIGKPFRIGELRCVGVEPCDPCRHLESLTQPGVLKGLARRGGLRADVLRGGEIAVGDPVEAT